MMDDKKHVLTRFDKTIAQAKRLVENLSQVYLDLSARGKYGQLFAAVDAYDIISYCNLYAKQYSADGFDDIETSYTRFMARTILFNIKEKVKLVLLPTHGGEVSTFLRRRVTEMANLESSLLEREIEEAHELLKGDSQLSQALQQKNPTFEDKVKLAVQISRHFPYMLQSIMAAEFEPIDLFKQLFIGNPERVMPAQRQWPQFASWIDSIPLATRRKDIELITEILDSVRSDSEYIQSNRSDAVAVAHCAYANLHLRKESEVLVFVSSTWSMQEAVQRMLEANVRRNLSGIFRTYFVDLFAGNKIFPDPYVSPLKSAVSAYRHTSEAYYYFANARMGSNDDESLDNVRGDLRILSFVECIDEFLNGRIEVDQQLAERAHTLVRRKVNWYGNLKIMQHALNSHLVSLDGLQNAIQKYHGMIDKALKGLQRLLMDEQGELDSKLSLESVNQQRRGIKDTILLLLMLHRGDKLRSRAMLTEKFQLGSPPRIEFRSPKLIKQIREMENLIWIGAIESDVSDALAHILNSGEEIIDDEFEAGLLWCYWHLVLNDNRRVGGLADQLREHLLAWSPSASSAAMFAERERQLTEVLLIKAFASLRTMNYDLVETVLEPLMDKLEQTGGQDPRVPQRLARSIWLKHSPAVTKNDSDPSVVTRCIALARKALDYAKECSLKVVDESYSLVLKNNLLYYLSFSADKGDLNEALKLVREVERQGKDSFLRPTVLHTIATTYFRAALMEEDQVLRHKYLNLAQENCEQSLIAAKAAFFGAGSARDLKDGIVLSDAIKDALVVC